MAKSAKRIFMDDEVPTPEELKEREERAAEVRSWWSEEERIRRGGGSVRARCEIKSFVFDGTNNVFTAAERVI
jgi:hypothetical protein